MKFRLAASRHAMRRGLGKCELCRQYCRALRSEFSCTAKINKLQIRFSDFLAVAKLCERAFEHGSLVVQNSGSVNAALQKFSGETVRDSAKRHRCKGEVVAFDDKSF